MSWAAGFVALTATAAGPAGTRTACPREAEAARLQTYGPVVHGDLDADGSRDRVWISAAPAAPWSCGIFLMARTRRRVASIRVPGGLFGPASVSLRQHLPRLYALLRLGSDRQLEPVVIVQRSPHAVGFAVYRLWQGRLVRMTLPGPGDGFLGWDTGSTTSAGVNCVGGPGSGRVGGYMVHLLEPGPHWYLDRRTYRVEGPRFALESSFAGFVAKKTQPTSALPFGKCAGVRAGA